jgi:quercetin dioxygenase-like cupin family protein
MTMIDVLHVTTHAQAWLPTGPGARMVVLRHEPGGWATTLLHFEAGARSRPHRHPGGEELFVLSGIIRVGDRRLVAGDYLYTPPGGVHDAEAEEETVLFLIVPRGIVYLDEPGT